MSKDSLDLLLTSLGLPRCFPFDFETRKPIPAKIKLRRDANGSSIGRTVFVNARHGYFLTTEQGLYARAH